MNSENVGEAIKNAFQFLGLIFADTAKMLTAVEEFMNKENFISLYGSTSVWNRSSAFYGSYGWLPHYFSRIYVPKEGPGQRPSIKGKLLAYVNIYFIPENMAQPVILYGAASLRSEDSDGCWNSWSSLMLSPAGPHFVNSVSEESWATYQCEGESQIGIAHFKVKPLVQFDDQTKVEAMCRELVDKFIEVKENPGDK
jgi:hypothetical protein